MSCVPLVVSPCDVIERTLLSPLDRCNRRHRCIGIGFVVGRFSQHGDDTGDHRLSFGVGNFASDLGEHRAVGFDDGVKIGVEVQLVVGQDRPVEAELLVAMKDPGDVDRDIELGEDLQLHAPAGDRQEGQRGYQRGVTGRCGIRLAVVGRVVVFDRDRELADLLAPHQKVVRRPIMLADQCLGFFGNCHAAAALRSNSC
ncbi:Putative uncharacterized protein [Mycobacterium tuberculosis variant bovis]|nr:Putative uncharacterized protein [Mycobacterium tuberculosis variant bovis]CEJ34082.1 Putative uncharacterized protein [Mycobacterium tuberculosis variant bovis]CEJ39962.1 Putative uncharacterized protein [Mycobacterium tuberculosis variant bovis]CEJ50920.1 Putative uncharacterized protein [Mycobacterium tuberculosis variant caprae]